MSAAHSIDAFLAATYGLHLEDLLCEGCLVGRLGPAMGERVKLVPRLVQSTSEDDGGGERFLADVIAFEPLGWETRVAIPA